MGVAPRLHIFRDVDCITSGPRLCIKIRNLRTWFRLTHFAMRVEIGNPVHLVQCAGRFSRKAESNSCIVISPSPSTTTSAPDSRYSDI